MISQNKHKKFNTNGLHISDPLYILLITESSKSVKRNALHNLISHQPDIDKIYLHAQDQNEGKYIFLIYKPESVDLKQTF